MNSYNPSIFSARLRELRKDGNETIQHAANNIGISFNSLWNYEHGYVEPTLSKADLLANYYGVSLDYLVGRCDE